MKMQSCFSQLLHELETTSSSTVLLLDSTLKCILQYTLWGFYWFIMSMFNFLTLVQCDKWRALGSEILFINNSLQWILSTPFCLDALKGLLCLTKKSFLATGEYILHKWDFYAKTTKSLNTRDPSRMGICPLRPHSATKLSLAFRKNQSF